MVHLIFSHLVRTVSEKPDRTSQSNWSDYDSLKKPSMVWFKSKYEKISETG